MGDLRDAVVFWGWACDTMIGEKLRHGFACDSLLSTPAEPMSTSQSKRKRSKARIVLFLCIAVVFVGLLLELGSFAIFSFTLGEMFSYGSQDERRGRIAAGKETGEVDARLASALEWITLHPYLGFVYDTESTKTDDYLIEHKAVVNEFGMTGPSSVQKRDPKRLIVGVTGGSVAHGMLMYAEGYLKRALRSLPQYRDREVVVVAMSMGGYKQPQQLMSLAYLLGLGGEFDLLINIDGFNELVGTYSNSTLDVFPVFPSNWRDLTFSAPDREMLKRVGKIVALQDERVELAKSYSGAISSHSVTLQVVWSLRDQRMKAAIDAARLRAASFKPSARLPFSARGPSAKGWTGPRRFDRFAHAWQRYSVQLDRLSRGNKIRYFHFLQPNQYVPNSKPIMGAEEREIAIDEEHPSRSFVEVGYPALFRQIPGLHRAGVRFRDLTWMYKDVKERVYDDNCCHMNKHGYELMAQTIVDTIAESAEFESAKLEGIQVERSDLVLDDPLSPIAIDVIGSFSDGKMRNVSAAIRGTTYESSSDAMRVSRDGGLRGVREGDATITVRNRGFSAEVKVTCRWRPVTSFGAGSPGLGRIAPVLSVAGESPQLGGKDITIRIQKVRGGAKGVLVVSPSLECIHGESIGGQRQQKGAVVVDIEADGLPDRPGVGSVEYKIPSISDPALRGRTFYVHAMFEDAAASSGHSLTNGLRVTVQ